MIVSLHCLRPLAPPLCRVTRNFSSARHHLRLSKPIWPLAMRKTFWKTMRWRLCYHSRAATHIISVLRFRGIFYSRWMSFSTPRGLFATSENFCDKMQRWRLGIVCHIFYGVKRDLLPMARWKRLEKLYLLPHNAK